MKKRYIIAFIISVFILIITCKLWLISLSQTTKKLDIYLFFIIFILSYVGVLKLIEYIISFEKKENQSLTDIAFVLIFFIMLFIPMSYINPAEKSEKENRTLAASVPLIKENGGINYNYGSNFDKWFNDRFNFRENLIKFYENKYLINKYTITDKLIKGKEDWVFYKGDISSVQSYQNINLFTIDELKLIAYKLQIVNDYCKQNNKQFYFMVAPDKSKIYGEYYSSLVKKVNPDENSKAQQLISYLETNTDIKVIYPYKTLISNKGKDLLYYKSDTHWNSLGAYYGYSDLIDTIKKDYPDIPEYNIIGYKQEEESGDLASMIPVKIRTPKKSLYDMPDLSNMEHFCQKTENAKDIQFCSNTSGKYNLIMFRDSFAIKLIPYLAESFNNSAYIWDYNINTALAQEADIVILEVVERSIYKLPNIYVEAYNAF